MPIPLSGFPAHPAWNRHLGGPVRKLLTAPPAPPGPAAAACSKKVPVAAMSDDLKNDLKLASTTQDIRINPDEITPAAKPEVALKVKKAPSGPKVVRTQRPTVMASAKPVEEAEIPSEVPDVQTTAPAPARTPSAGATRRREEREDPSVADSDRRREAPKGGAIKETTPVVGAGTC